MVGMRFGTRESISIGHEAFGSAHQSCLEKLVQATNALAGGKRLRQCGDIACGVWNQ